MSIYICSTGSVILVCTRPPREVPGGGEGGGVMSAALGRFITAMLYMDDTTLVARSKVGLRSLTEKYIYAFLHDVQDETEP